MQYPPKRGTFQRALKMPLSYFPDVKREYSAVATNASIQQDNSAWVYWQRVSSRVTWKHALLLLVAIVAVYIAVRREKNLPDRWCLPRAERLGYLGHPHHRMMVALGESEMASSRVVVAATLRDVEKRIPEMRQTTSELLSRFADYRILIVENDSSDRTRELLLEWAAEDSRVIILGCGKINAPKCELGLPRTVEHWHLTERIKKMAQVRNVYLDYLQPSKEMQQLAGFDYLIVWDLDIQGNLPLDGVASSFGHLSNQTSLDAVCAYGYKRKKNMYLDIFAHVPEKGLMPGDSIITEGEEPRNATSNDVCRGPESRDHQRRDLEVHSQMQHRNPLQLFPVRSCFGGMTIYRLNASVRNARYGAAESGEAVICEHLFFHRGMDMAMNPMMLYAIHRH